MMLRYIRGKEGGSLIEPWLTVKQESTVEEYVKFIQFASNLDEEMSKELLLANFIRRLDWRI